MKKFTFRLQAVLEHRERVERARRAELAQARRRVLDGERAAQAAQDALGAAREELRRSEGAGSLNVVDALRQREHLASLRRRVDASRVDLRRIELEFGRCREAYLRARNERKTLAMLKERRQARHLQGVARAELAEMNDVAQQREALARKVS